ncbi:MAG TPA: hypothetical protein VF230_05400 [Acidimicrobiales bacterium]
MMMRYEWNTLRVGDAVFVHVADEGGQLVSGTVAFVKASPVDDGTNDVGVRVVSDDETSYVWPSMEELHGDPVAVGDACPQCTVTAG